MTAKSRSDAFPTPPTQPFKNNTLQKKSRCNANPNTLADNKQGGELFFLKESSVTAGVTAPVELQMKL